MHLTDSQIAAYPEYIQESVGMGSYDNFPDINESPTQTAPNAPLRPGQIIFDRDGKGYMYVRTSGAMVKGDLVKASDLGTGFTVQTADATGNNIQVIKTDITGCTLNSEKGNWLLFAAAGLATVWRRIKANSLTTGGVTYFTISVKNTIAGQRGYDPDAPAAAIAAGTSVSLWKPHTVAVCGVQGYAVGVSRNTVTSGYNTLIGVHGVHLAKVVGSVTAVTAGGPAVPGAAGTIVGPAATPSGLDAWSAVGRILIASSGASALMPVHFNVLGRIQ